jgi:endonuclease/exonuclease/phosphatase family metal-dependent hydrolase
MIRVGSWNLRNLSTKRDLKQIAEIIGRYDIVALQEIRSIEAVKEIAEYAVGYSYVVSEPVCSTKTTAKQTGKRREMYAFLWRAPIENIEECRLVHGEEVFVRSPYVGFFRARHFDFVLGTIHVVWGRKKDRDLEIAGVSKLLDLIASKGRGEKDIILCGDFNMAPEKFSVGPKWYALIEEGTVVGSGSRYDNIWTSVAGRGKSGVYRDFKNSSDHYPIWAEFDDTADLDEGTPDIDIEIKNN